MTRRLRRRGSLPPGWARAAYQTSRRTWSRASAVQDTTWNGSVHWVAAGALALTTVAM